MRLILHTVMKMGSLYIAMFGVFAIFAGILMDRSLSERVYLISMAVIIAVGLM